MATVLGKRSRGSSDSPDTSFMNTRSKRRVQPKIFYDEAQESQSSTSKKPITKATTRTKAGQKQRPKLGEKLMPSKDRTPARGRSGRTKKILSPREPNSQPDIVAPFGDENAEPVQLQTPNTPRRRDALSKQTPVTPKHRVGVPGSFLTPQTVRTPSSSNILIPNVYNIGRQLFVRSVRPERLVGRDSERKVLDDFVHNSLYDNGSCALYTSGPPGTGKSAMVDEVFKAVDSTELLVKASINCMSLKTSKDLYFKIMEDLRITVTETDPVVGLRKAFEQNSDASKCLLILDEIDHLLTLDLEILYTLFEYSLQPSSRLVLIGIANALDLTDRFLPRLKARNFRPQVLQFLPYTAPQIATVITSKLQSLDEKCATDFTPLLHPAAIQLCSKKVAKQSGDLRKAFDICRKAVDLMESETKQKFQQQATDQQLSSSPSKTPLGENINMSSPMSLVSPESKGSKANGSSVSKSLQALTFENAPRASIAHVAKIASGSFGNGTAQRLKSLNLQQKAALCCLVALERKKRAAAANVLSTPSKTARAAPSIQSLFQSYLLLCKRDRLIHPLTSVEFRDVMNSLETLSLVSALNGKNGSFSAVTGTPSKRMKLGFAHGGGDERLFGSCVGEQELEMALEGPGSEILKAFLRGDGLDD